MFRDNVAWIYDLFANVVNRRANQALCKEVEGLIEPNDDVLECACGTGLLSGVIGYDAETAKAVAQKAKPKYRAIIKEPPPFEKGDRFRMNIVNCALLGAFILTAAPIFGSKGRAAMMMPGDSAMIVGRK